MTVLQRLQGDLGEVGLRLRRASPRGADRMVLELGAEDGSIAAGQWFASAEEADRVCTLVNARYEGRATGAAGQPAPAWSRRTGPTAS